MKSNVEIVKMLIDEYCMLTKWNEYYQVQADYLDDVEYDDTAYDFALKSQFLYGLILNTQLDKETALYLYKKETEYRIRGVKMAMNEFNLDGEWKETFEKRIRIIEHDRDRYIKDFKED